MTYENPIMLSEYVSKELLSEGLVIKPSLIMSSHTQLLESIRNKNIPYIMRKKGAVDNSSFRGVEIEHRDFQKKIVFSDNSPGIWLFNQLISNDDLAEKCANSIIDNLEKKKVPLAHVYKSTEKEQSPLWPSLLNRMTSYPANWNAGWKLSHIFPCSPQSNDSNCKLTILVNSNPTLFFQIRFLRNMSPFNYFLSPMSKRFKMLLNGESPIQNDLGEDSDVINWVIYTLYNLIFKGNAEIQNAFKTYILDIGLQENFNFETPPNDKEVLVTKKDVMIKTKSVRFIKTEMPKIRVSSQALLSYPASKPHNTFSQTIYSCNIFQVSQTNNNEAIASILVAPDGACPVQAGMTQNT